MSLCLPYRDKMTPPGKLSYKDFIWFLLSEEDKTSQRRSVEATKGGGGGRESIEGWVKELKGKDM